jgi:hypothetical protein
MVLLRLGGTLAAFLLLVLASAGGWVAYQNGFGGRDLIPLLIWASPLGVCLGATALLMNRLRTPSLGWLRAGMGGLVGAGLGVVWTLAMARMMGPWFGTMSLPVLPIFAGSGAAALGVSSTLKARGS